MSIVFTYFNDDAYGHGARVYPGKVRTEYRTPLAFRIKTGPNEFSLYDGSRPYFGQLPLILHGRFDGVGGSDRSSGKIQGFHTIHNLGLDTPTLSFSSTSHRCYYFVDAFSGIKYKWKVNWWGNGWKLVDERNNQTVASFKKASSSTTFLSNAMLQGRLTILQPGLPEHLLALILLTQKLVHNRLQTEGSKPTKNLVHALP
ncbi:hypothetical protein [Absidia glauca]|jgi:hypothetical protein|uniref:Uncharacterized protein n=1 Tax=Absidia glauca TaxID=4829 RepID=A0A168Q3K3_ABSGL|nr:hypothetical protein [Absidia glauca]